MELTDLQKSKTGAFYTPKIWADKAVECIKSIVPDISNYFFWDMAAGEGALLEALPKECEKYGTTLEYEDYQILKEKGFNCNQFDFLKGDINNLAEIKDIPKGRLIIFTNPPYVKLIGDEYINLRKKYKTDDATALFFHKIIDEVCPLLLCSFNKLDLYQAPIHTYFRKKIPIAELTIAQFLTPSCSWGLKGTFPISFNILACY
jgi:hypothetical protein